MATAAARPRLARRVTVAGVKRKDRPSLTLSAREVVAAGGAFSPRGEAITDVGVALDEIMSLEAGQEAVVLRVAMSGERLSHLGRPAASLAGDWLCEPGGGPPRRLTRLAWPVGYGREWAARRPTLDAWESCRNAQWMVRLLCAQESIARHLPVEAACACVRSAYEMSRAEYGPSTTRGLREAESWLRGQSSARHLAEAVQATTEWVEESVVGELETAAAYAAADAADAALYAEGEPGDPTGLEDGRYAHRGWRFSAASAVHEATTLLLQLHGGHEMAGRLADVVRSSVPTIDVLRAALQGA